MNFALMDNKTGNNIQHVTYIVSIYNQENKNKFTANLHGHDGEIKLEFLNTGERDSIYTQIMIHLQLVMYLTLAVL
jgi:hypothetical protein